MNLLDAIHVVRATGGRIRRRSWKGGSLVVDGAHIKEPKMFFVARDRARGGLVIARHWKPTVAELFGDDWIVLDTHGGDQAHEAVEAVP
jgi:hypothetical protein